MIHATTKNIEALASSIDGHNERTLSHIEGRPADMVLYQVRRELALKALSDLYDTQAAFNMEAEMRAEAEDREQEAMIADLIDETPKPFIKRNDDGAERTSHKP